jgi:hypothetical protein
MAVASLVCGVVSPCTGGLTAIPGLVLGIAGLARVRRSAGALAGRGLAIAGIITSLVGLMILLVVVLGVLILISNVVESESRMVSDRVADTPRSAAAQSMISMSLLGRAMGDYADAHDGRLPPAEAYPDGLATYLDRSPGDAVRSAGGRRVAMNAGVAGLPLGAIPDPDRTVLLFETGPDGAPVCGREGLRPLAGTDDAYVVTLVSGRVVWVTGEELRGLIWDPSGRMIRL